MRTLFAVFITVIWLAGCSFTDQVPPQVSQATMCEHHPGAVFLDCEPTVQLAAQTGVKKTKIKKPYVPNGNLRGKLTRGVLRGG